MKIPKLLIFGAGYVIGTRAGRERYDELRTLARRIADQLEAKVAPDGGSGTDPDT